MNLNQAIEDDKKYRKEQEALMEPSGFVKELSREEFISKMQEYDIVGFRVVLRES
jgi:hypothetical protein